MSKNLLDPDSLTRGLMRWCVDAAGVLAILACLGLGLFGATRAGQALMDYINRDADAAERQRRVLVCTYACRSVTHEAADPNQYRCSHGKPCHCSCPNGLQVEVF